MVVRTNYFLRISSFLGDYTCIRIRYKAASRCLVKLFLRSKYQWIVIVSYGCEIIVMCKCNIVLFHLP